MHTGWWKPYDIDRLLQLDEKRAALPTSRQLGIDPYEWGALIHFNSTYADFIDRRYRLRGMIHTTLGALVFLLLLFSGVSIVGVLVYEDYGRGDLFEAWSILSYIMIGAVSIGGAAVLYHIGLRFDLFKHTHYPIRFNRRTGQVHVFRDEKDGGILSAPWQSLFFHVGVGQFDKDIRDLRAHVLDGEMVKDTFVVGHYFDDTQLDRLRGLWEFIRRYMDEGPEAVAKTDADRHIRLSIATDWTNCYVWVMTYLGPTLYPLRHVLFPIYGLLTLSRWLVFKSCKAPRWPPEIEAESVIDLDDPHCWREPSYTGQFDNDDAVWARTRQRFDLPDR